MSDEEVREVEAPDGAEQETGDPSEFEMEEVEVEGLEPYKPTDTKPKPKDEPDGEKKEEPSVEDLKGRLEKAEKKVGDLNKALHEERKAKKQAAAKDTEEPPLSDTELRELWKAHKDEPDALFNIAKYMAQQAAKGASKETVSKAELAKNAQEMSDLLHKRVPKLYEDGSDERAETDRVKDKLGLADHPYGDFFAVATQTYLQLPGVLKQVYDKGREDALKGAGDKTREQLVKDSQPAKKPGAKQPDKKEDTEGLTASQLETAKRMGFGTGKGMKPLSLYKKVVLGQARTVTMGG